MKALRDFLKMLRQVFCLHGQWSSPELLGIGYKRAISKRCGFCGHLKIGYALLQAPAPGRNVDPERLDLTPLL